MKFYKKGFKKKGARSSKILLRLAMPYSAKPIICNQIFTIAPNPVNLFAFNIGSLLPNVP